MVNSAGTLVLDHTEYQAFGGVASDTNAAAASAYEFDGERYNRTTGMLQSDGARDVNTQTDQWDAEDPSGFEAAMRTCGVSSATTRRMRRTQADCKKMTAGMK